MWGSADGGMWGVGDKGYVWQPPNWSASSISVSYLAGISGTSSSDVWVAGTRGEIQHFDGTRWSSPRSVGPFEFNVAVYAASSDQIWVSSHHATGLAAPLSIWNGERWSFLEVDGGLGRNRMTAFSGPAHDVWVGGKDGVILRSDGGSITRVPFPSSVQIKSIAYQSPTSVWVGTQGERVADSQIYLWNGAGWSVVTPPPGEVDVYSVVVVNGEVFFSGYQDVYRRAGSTWQKTDAGSELFLASVLPNELWAASKRSLQRYVAGNWVRYRWPAETVLSEIGNICGEWPSLHIYDRFYNSLGTTDGGTVTQVGNVNIVTGCSTAPDGTTWATTYQGGLLRHNRR
jgi:hypothetical protein